MKFRIAMEKVCIGEALPVRYPNYGIYDKVFFSDFVYTFRFIWIICLEVTKE